MEASWQDHLTQARQFWATAQMAMDHEYANQAASNAILAVIAANDAVCVRLGAGRPAGDQHTEAAVAGLRATCRGTAWEKDAAEQGRRLVDIVGQKNAAQYYGRDISAEQADRIMKQAERFLGWVERVLKSPR